MKNTYQEELKQMIERLDESQVRLLLSFIESLFGLTPSADA